MRPRMETNRHEELGEPRMSRMSRIAQIQHSSFPSIRVIRAIRGRLPLSKESKK